MQHTRGSLAIRYAAGLGMFAVSQSGHNRGHKLALSLPVICWVRQQVALLNALWVLGFRGFQGCLCARFAAPLLRSSSSPPPFQSPDTLRAFSRPRRASSGGVSQAVRISMIAGSPDFHPADHPNSSLFSVFV